MTEEDNTFLRGFIEGFTLKPFQELKGEIVGIKSRLAAMELTNQHNKQILVTLEQGLREAIRIEEARLNEMGKTDERLTTIERFIGDTSEFVLKDVATQHDNLCTDVERLEARLKAVEGNGNGNGTRLKMEDLKPATGIDALFDDAPLYRHVCTNPKCKHHLINRQVSGVRCSRCKYAMESHEVVKRGARGKYKARQGVKA